MSRISKMPALPEEKIKIEDLGYTPFFEAGRSQLDLNNFPVARVISESKKVYRVKNTNGEYLAKITGTQIFKAVSREDYPAVGDWVAVTELDDHHAVIRGILPRSTIIKRKYGDKDKAGEKNKTQIIAANIDIAFVIESVDRDYNLNRFERYFAIAENGGVRPAIILNKIDLLSREELDKKLTQLKNRFSGIDVISTSTVNEKGLYELRRYIHKGKTYCFLGSSGVGKSSLINKLLGENTIKTGDVSSNSGRGKHVTTARQMYFLKDGGIVIDNPGMREVGMADASRGIDVVFDEVIALARGCRYSDCTHVHEPECAVIDAVRSGRLDKGKYSNYTSPKKETAYYEANEVERREQARRFGKFINKAKKELKHFGRKLI